MAPRLRVAIGMPVRDCQAQDRTMAQASLGRLLSTFAAPDVILAIPNLSKLLQHVLVEPRRRLEAARGSARSRFA
jgi:hypothetical protein